MKIYIVDDDPMDRLFICNALRAQDRDITLLECKSGLEAIDQSEDDGPIYALIDIRMPGLDGFETCEAIRKSMPGRECYVHMLTTSAEKKDHDAALEHGAHAVHIKPDTGAEYSQLARDILTQWDVITWH